VWVQHLFFVRIVWGSTSSSIHARQLSSTSSLYLSRNAGKAVSCDIFNHTAGNPQEFDSIRFLTAIDRHDKYKEAPMSSLKEDSLRRLACREV
jgi:hypothetical protein